jgi:hypothetical protein
MRLGHLLGVAVLAGIAATSAPAAVTEERTCRGTIGGATVDNLRVPQGATCVLKGTRIKGRIRVLQGATLRATSIRVVGNLQGENHAHVQLRASRIGGSIQLVQGGGAQLDRNAVKGDIQAFENRRQLTITRNRVDGNLQCKANSPRPGGGGNIVQGSKQDQCARL